MNTPIAVVFGLMLLTIVAHLVGGLRESLQTNPDRYVDLPSDSDAGLSLRRNWTQLMCAFQLVSVDLIAVTIVLYFLAFTDAVLQYQFVALGIAALFFAWGVAWLLQIAALKREPREYLMLGHWSFWFFCSAMVFWGAA